MELRQLEMLRAVIESGGFAPAGKLLHISHSAIHRQIRLLEQELDCRLLGRSGRAVEPTGPGRFLADFTLRVGQEISDVRSQISDWNNLRRGNLRIGTSSSILVSFLPAVLKRFLRKYPGVRLRLITGIAGDLIEEVLAGRLDIAIIFNPEDLPPPLPKLDCEVFYREEFNWAVGKNHPLAKKAQVGLSDLAAYPLITLPLGSHLRRACDRLFVAGGLVPTVITEIESEEAIDKLVEINLGFALRSRRRPANAKIRCFRIPNHGLLCEVGVVQQKRSYVPQTVTEFIRMCREAKLDSAD